MVSQVSGFGFDVFGLQVKSVHRGDSVSGFQTAEYLDLPPVGSACLDLAEFKMSVTGPYEYACMIADRLNGILGNYYCILG